MIFHISIIIPTYNAEKYLPTLLKQLKHQTVSFELIIIDSSSLDQTIKIAKSYTEKVVVIPQTEFDHGGTRAKAAKMATGDILVFLTQDALPTNGNSIEKLVKVFENPKVSAAYARQISYPKTNLFGKHLRIFNYGQDSYIRSRQDIDKFGLKTAFLSDSFAAYRKSVLEEIGWFKNGLILGEDTYVGAKMLLADYSLAYVSEAEVYHSHSYTIYEEFKRYFDTGVFHKTEAWILKKFGKAEGEGIRYIKSEWNYLLKNRAWYLIPEFCLRNTMKYFGYFLGKHYRIIPKWLIKKISMHKQWWDKIL